MGFPSLNSSHPEATILILYFLINLLEKSSLALVLVIGLDLEQHSRAAIVNLLLGNIKSVLCFQHLVAFELDHEATVIVFLLVECSLTG